MMGDENVQFNDVNKQVIEDCRERIERLFGVRLGISENGNGRCNCQIVCQSGNAPEVLVKTKNYINALTTEGAGFSITTESFNLHQVNMILQNKDVIEKESSTVLLASPYSSNVRLQGQLQDIILAKNIIETLFTQEPAAAGTSRELNTPHTCDTKIDAPSQGSVNRTEFEQSREVDTDVNRMLELGKTAGSESWATEKYIQEHLNNLGIDTTVEQLRLTSDSEDSDSDSEELFNDIQKDPDYRNKVEFAFKLGYQEGDLLQALRKLGNQASQNELLSELIKQGSSKGEFEGSGSDGSPILSPEHESDFLEFGLQQRRSNLDPSSNLRHIIIDGSNVAMSHGNKEVFSCMGIKLAVDWFRNRGHTNITVFVPQWRKETSRADARIKDQAILNHLEKEKNLVFTPARRIGGKRVVCYDDRYILKLAVETDGIVVSNDNYRDLSGEREEFKKVIEERLLMYSFVNDRFMPPDDPLGRNGPTLDNFLLIQPLEPEPLPPPCPYGSKKCTYGNKCKYYHPERKNQPHKMVTEKLAEQAKQRMQEMKDRNTQQSADGKRKLSKKMSLSRTTSLNTGELSRQGLPGSMSDQRTGSISNLQNADEKYVEYMEYNQKLTESLRKMEKEHAKKETLSQGMHKSLTMSPERGSSELRSRGGDYSDRQSSPRWSGIRTSREASPVNLAVPGHTSGLDSGEQFVSGHLLLAKKLSDEANESDKLRKMERRHESGSNSPNSSQQFQRIGGIGQSPDSKKLKPKQPVVKQKLSRQLSLQGGEDPRLKTAHSALRAQYSLDPKMPHSRQPMYHMNSNESSLMRDFMNSQSFDGQKDLNVTSSGASPGLFGAIGQGIPSHMHKSHTPLSRMQSAPIPQHPSQMTQLPARPVPMMMRQNSSSDTQLNKLDHSDDTGYGGDRTGHHEPIGDHLRHRGSIGEVLSHRGSLPMKDKSGALTFQIGGGAPLRQPLQHYSSMGALNQGFQQYRTSDQDYMFQQPQFLSQTYSDIPQSRMPFMHGNHGNNTIHHQQQQTPAGYSHQRSSPSFMPSQPQVRDPSQLIDQSGIWQNNQQYESTNMPPNMGSMNMLSQSMTRHSQPSSHHHPLIQQQFSIPIPEDRPITADDPRYKLYFHLCGLFPEEKVRLVMNQHPETMNAKEICAYIISSG